MTVPDANHELTLALAQIWGCVPDDVVNLFTAIRDTEQLTLLRPMLKQLAELKMWDLVRNGDAGSVKFVLQKLDTGEFKERSVVAQRASDLAAPVEVVYGDR